MPKRAFLSLIVEVSGNVNADAGVGVRIPIKKVVTWNREVRAFVSPRCIRRGIRARLAEKNFAIDPQMIRGDQLADVGDPVKYVDDDLFGYLAPKKGEKEIQPSRTGPVKVSPLIALHHTEISVEFAGRFPRADISSEAIEANPVPFEIETARWLGMMHVIISENIGKFRLDELTEEVANKMKSEYSPNIEVSGDIYELKRDEREKRLKALMEILIKEGWMFPRGSEATDHPEFHYALLILSSNFIPTSNIMRMTQEMELDYEAVKSSLELYNWEKVFIIDYRKMELKELHKKEKDEGIDERVEKLSDRALNGVINAVTEFLL
ncbi:MAG: type I-B CRISPR-associated protein Cas7/Cst2/DevR [Fervidicoccaceae archaeon]